MLSSRNGLPAGSADGSRVPLLKRFAWVARKCSPQVRAHSRNSGSTSSRFIPPCVPPLNGSAPTAMHPSVHAGGKLQIFCARPFGRIEPAFAQFVQLLRGGGNRGFLRGRRERKGKSFKALCRVVSGVVSFAVPATCSKRPKFVKT